MPTDFTSVFTVLKPIIGGYEKNFTVKADTPVEYTVLTRVPSPLPQHKGEPMYFASVRLGKAYVSFHLMPLYMCEEMTKQISPALRKRMQGKTCFNFKTTPDAELIKDLKQLTKAGVDLWLKKAWL